MRSRPIQCYRCLSFGHMGHLCQEELVKTGLCFRCGSDSHIARACTSAPRCSLCTNRGFPADHRMGERRCFLLSGRRARQASVVLPLGPASDSGRTEVVASVEAEAPAEAMKVEPSTVASTASVPSPKRSLVNEVTAAIGGGAKKARPEGPTSVGSLSTSGVPSDKRDGAEPAPLPQRKLRPRR